MAKSIYYLETAMAWIKSSSYNEGLKYISGAYYNIGNVELKEGRPKVAFGLLDSACSIWISWMNKSNSEESKYEDSIILAKRYEILALCHLALKDKKVKRISYFIFLYRNISFILF